MDSKKLDTIQKVIAAEIYLYIIFMFITKGEAIRNILLFSSFILWLYTIRSMREKIIFKHPVSVVFFLTLISILPSVVFSLDPVYSLRSLKVDPLKALIIFCLISTVLADDRRLNGFLYIALTMFIFTVVVGYYSYWVYDMEIMKPITWIRHAWHSRFAIDLNTLMPFVFMLLLRARHIASRIFLTAVLFAGILGVILSTSRGGIAGFAGMAAVWFLYLMRRKKIRIKFAAAGLALVLLLLALSLSVSPVLKNKLISDRENIFSLGRRTEIWGPLITAAARRPLLGWGYGSGIFKRDEPFHETPYKEAPFHKDPAFRNPHNPFLRILFHQGVLSAIIYLVLIVLAIRTFWKSANACDDIKGLILISCTGILVGTYIINAIVENSQLRDLAFVLGLGMAAMGCHEDRYN